MKEQIDKISKAVEDSNNTINQLDLIEIDRTLQLMRTKTYCFQVLMTYKNKSQFKRIQVVQNMFSDHNGIKLKINNRRKLKKSPNI